MNGTDREIMVMLSIVTKSMERIAKSLEFIAARIEAELEGEEWKPSAYEYQKNTNDKGE